MLTVQTVTANKERTSSEGGVTSERPQSSVLLQFLWNLEINKLLGEVEGQRWRVVGYADYLLIVVRGPFLETLKHLKCSKKSGDLLWENWPIVQLKED